MPGYELNTVRGMKAVVDRLAAYEETELAPEEVVALQASNQELKKEALPLLQAKIQDRMVVLPCKVGDMLYEVDLPEYGVITCEVLHIGTYNGPEAHVPGNPMVSAVSVGVEVVEGHGKGSGYAFEAEDFGKSVFTTREEAEAALKEQER